MEDFGIGIRWILRLGPHEDRVVILGRARIADRVHPGPSPHHRPSPPEAPSPHHAPSPHPDLGPGWLTI